MSRSQNGACASPALLRESPREFTDAELRRKFRWHEVAAVNQCSGSRRGLFAPHVPGVQWGYGAMGNAVWGGVRLKEVLEDAGLAAGALEVKADGADLPTLTGPDFVKSLPMWKALDEDTLIAFEMNGERLSRWNGFPARLVVPGWTATYWVKALTELSVLDRPFDGFWMKTAYRVPKGLFGESALRDAGHRAEFADHGDSRQFADRRSGTRRNAQDRKARRMSWASPGTAAPESAMSKSHSTTARSWRKAKLGRDLGRYSWRQWRFGLEPMRPGALTLMARAWARDGSTQPESLIANPAGYHHNVVQKIEYQIA